MANIKSFNGLRYNCSKAGDINELICPPYDIISDKQREDYLEKNGYNIIRLELPKGENSYKVAGETLSNWIDEEILAKDEKAGIYVYEMEFSTKNLTGKKVKGFISLVKLEEFSKGIVLPHEETLSKAKEDRFNLMSETFSNFSQIYSLYMDEDNSCFSMIDSLSSGKADVEVTDVDGVIHRLWCVYDEVAIEKLTEKFLEKKLYIADGHHRYETALNFHKSVVEKGLEEEHPNSDHVCMCLVNMENDGLVVFPTHRIVRSLENFDLEDVISKCSEYFEISKKNDVKTIENSLEIAYNEGKKSYVLYAGNDEYYFFTLKDESAIEKFVTDKSKSYCDLDVTILHTLILELIFGIDKENMANQINLTYTKIFEEAIETVDNGSANCVFILNPTRVSEIRDVALNNEKMPQKSTYFYPKLITGLVMNKF